MGKKICSSMHPRNLGSDKIVRIDVRPPLRVSWGEILHFKQGDRFGSKSHGHQDFETEKTRTKLSLRLNFISTLEELASRLRQTANMRFKLRNSQNEK